MGNFREDKIDFTSNKLFIHNPLMVELGELQNKSAIRQVLGCLIKKPSLAGDYKFLMEDFIEPEHRLIYASVITMARDLDIKIITEATIHKFLKENHPTYVLPEGVYNKKKCGDLINQIIASTIEDNFESNYTEMKKWSLLRYFYMQGIDISYYYDSRIVDPKIVEEIRSRFVKDSLTDFMDHFKMKIINVQDTFGIARTEQEIQAGGKRAMDTKNEQKEHPMVGYSYASNFLTTATDGMLEGKLTIHSASSGTGKTRLAIANMCNAFVPTFWDPATKTWKDNPHGTDNAALFIGTEQQVDKEIEPIIWSYMACVDQHHISTGEYEPGEEERVEHAIRALGGKRDWTVEDDDNYEETTYNRINLVHMADYNRNSIAEIIEKYVVKYKVKAVFLDYIWATPALISEYDNENKGQTRQDQALLALSAMLKECAEKYHIVIESATQLSGEYGNSEIRDERIVRGAKSIVDKCDVATIISRPTPKEIALIEKNIPAGEKNPFRDGFGNTIEEKMPNVCINLYKNRGIGYNKIKIWLKVDYSTMRVHDLFVTGYDYIALALPKTCVYVDNDGMFKSFQSNDKQSAGALMDDYIKGNITKATLEEVTEKYELNDMKASLTEEEKKRLNSARNNIG